MLFLLWLACTQGTPDTAPESDSGGHTHTDTPTDSADTGDTSDTEASGPVHLAVAAGHDHTCVLIRDEPNDPVRVQCLGRSDAGQRDVPAPGSWTALAAGGATTCASSDTQVVCWGHDPALPPGLAAPPEEVVGGISLSATVGCGLHGTGVLSCWGDNSVQQAEPPVIQGAWQQTAAGSRHGCGRTSGTLRCWGDGTQGQLLSPTGQFTDVDSGARHACAVGSDASLRCWGDNRHGQARPPLNELFRAVALGSEHSCALRTDDFPRCFGRSDHGQTLAPEATPLEQISAGTRHSCGITSEGALLCWGYAPSWAN